MSKQAHGHLPQPSLTLAPKPDPDATFNSCSSLHAVHDLAALAEGSLSPQALRQLARHVAHCRACRVVLAAVVSDAQAAASSGLLPIAPVAAATRAGRTTQPASR
jgi:anti-sigma factor RsiW